MPIHRKPIEANLPSDERQRWRAFLAPRDPQAIIDTLATMDAEGIEPKFMIDNIVGDDDSLGVLVIGKAGLIHQTKGLPQ